MENQPTLKEDANDTAAVAKTQPTKNRRITTAILVLVTALLLGYVLYVQLMLEPVVDSTLPEPDVVVAEPNEVVVEQELTELEQLQQRMSQEGTQVELNQEQATELTELMDVAAPATAEQMAELEVGMKQN